MPRSFRARSSGFFSRLSWLSLAATVALSVAAAWAADTAPANPRFTGSPFMQVWATDELGAAPVNRAVIQHPRSGFIYVGNNAGVLEFDGVRWQLIPVPGGQARALVIDARERLWFLSPTTISRFEASAGGGLGAVSAMDRLSEDERALGRTVGALATSEGIYFSSLQNLIFFRITARASSSTEFRPPDKP